MAEKSGKNKTGSERGEMRIFLTHRDQVLYEFRSSDYVREISIGRSADCTWSLGHVDASASARHAIISSRKGVLYITDLGSKNGTFCHGKAIKEKKLVPGDAFVIGECVLNVVAGNAKAKKTLKFHQLQYLNERGRRVVVDLHRGLNIIGSSRSAEIYLPNALVSTRHAEIDVRADGSCWLKDLGSRNGTFVNGRELGSDSERLLKDSDIIALADAELTFLDGTIEHQRSRLLPGLVAAAITVLVCLAGYLAYIYANPPAPEMLKSARAAVAQQDFGEARKILEDAAWARDSDVFAKEREKLLQRTAKWEKNYQLWNDTQALMQQKKWKDARQRLGLIDLRSADAWNWDDKTAVALKKEAEFVKELLDWQEQAYAIFNDPNGSVADMMKYQKLLQDSLPELQEYSSAYVPVLLEYLQSYLQGLALVQERQVKLEQVYAELRSGSKPDFNALVDRLLAMRNEAGGVQRVMIDKLTFPLLSLQKASKQLTARRELIVDMQFEKSTAQKIDFSEYQNLSGQASLDNWKNEFLLQEQKLQQFSEQMLFFLANLRAQDIEPGAKIPAVELFLDQEKMAKVYACDSLALPLPKRNRQQYSGVYDECVGFEFLFSYLNNLRLADAGLPVLDEFALPPKIMQVRKIFQDLSLLAAFLDSPENKWSLQGKMKEFRQYIGSVLAQREKIVQSAQEFCPDKGRREYYIGQGIASLLGVGAIASAENKLALGLDFANFRRELQVMNSSYDDLRPEEAIQVRDLVIRQGLPGDPVVRRMMSLR